MKPFLFFKYVETNSLAFASYTPREVHRHLLPGGTGEGAAP